MLFLIKNSEGDLFQTNSNSFKLAFTVARDAILFYRLMYYS
jgi:hypothetical protein